MPRTETRISMHRTVTAYPGVGPAEPAEDAPQGDQQEEGSDGQG